MIEILEARIAPAAVFSYTDVAGNKVTITSSKGTDAELASAAGNITTGQLQNLYLTNGVYAGANVTITARVQHGSGDGFADIGFIDGGTNDLGSITVRGDLGAMGAGDGTGIAVRSLSVQSLGQLGTSTGANSLVSTFDGGIGALNVTTDVVEATVIALGNMGTVTIGGSLIGGIMPFTGFLKSTGNMGAVKIGGDVIAGSSIETGCIFSQGTLAGVTVGGSLIGGAYYGTGAVVSTENMGPVRIGHDVTGAGALQSGCIAAGLDDIGSALSPETPANISSIAIGGSLTGGSAQGSGLILASLNIGPVKIGGSITSGQTSLTGEILSQGAIASLTVGGSITGSASYPVLINAEGPATHSARADVAIGSISVGGDVIMSDIEAGYSSGSPFNTEAQIGTVRVGGDWIASNLVAGVKNSASSNMDFGNSNDAVIATGAGIVSKIGRIAIGGEVEGTPSSVSSSDNFGFVAQTIGSFSVGGAAITLAAGSGALLRPLGVTGDVDIHELGY